MSLYSTPKWLRGWIAVFLLLVLIELSASLLLLAGEFIHSDEVLISPFRICLACADDETESGSWRDPKNMECWPHRNDFLATAVMLCLYVPVVLVAFGLLAAVFAAYADDRAAMRLGMLCQGASGLLLLAGIVGFLLLHRIHVTWRGLTCGFYACLCAQAELAITTALTNRSMKSGKSADVTAA